MAAVLSSQLAPLPDNLPFRVVSETIGQGAYAFIRKAVPVNQSSPVVAIKFINKEHAYKRGRLKEQQLRTEITLHKHLGKHQNIIELITYGDSPSWIWIAMELADGGDLFDKIEADVGVGEDVAHFYFFQLINAVAYMHDRGVSHRDLKPENILLSSNGDLKLADFGLATLYHFKGKYRPSTTVCGSPPYIAPEILQLGKKAAVSNYDPAKADLWSCGIVLFVLLCGNTPWDEPSVETSQEFYDYVRTHGRPQDDELWDRLPSGVTSLLRKMLMVDPNSRMGLDDIKRHTWFTRPNQHLNTHGRVRDPVALATQMLQSLRINFSAPIRPNLYAMPPNWRKKGATPEVKDEIGDDDLFEPQFPLTQPEAQTNHGNTFAPTNIHANFTASQPVPSVQGLSFGSSFSNAAAASSRKFQLSPGSQPVEQLLTTNPALSQFSQPASDPRAPISSSSFLSLTQQARQFNDLVPAYSLTHFLSIRSPALVVSSLETALHTLGVPVPYEYLAAQYRNHPSAATVTGPAGVPPPPTFAQTTQMARNPLGSSTAGAAASPRRPPPPAANIKNDNNTSKSPILPFVIPVRTTAGRRLQPLRGSIVVEEQHGDTEALVMMASGHRIPGGGSGGGNVAGNPSAGLLEIRFVKTKGDPVEWRRLFKRVVVLCKEVVWLPDC